MAERCGMKRATFTKIETARLAKLRELCSTLPQVKFEPVGERHFAMKVGPKTFAWYLNDHHGDGMVSVCAKSTLARQRELVAADPQRYFVPAYVGKAGWVGLRVDLPRVDWGPVLELLVAAYRFQAPRRLVAELE